MSDCRGRCVAFYAQIKTYVNPWVGHFVEKVFVPSLTRRERRSVAVDCRNI